MLLVSCIFGCTDGLELLPSDESALWLRSSHFEMPRYASALAASESWFQIKRLKTGTGECLMVGIYRRAREMSSSRPGGFYGAAILVEAGYVLDSTSCLHYVTALADQVKASALAGEQFVRSLRSISHAIDWRQADIVALGSNTTLASVESALFLPEGVASIVFPVDPADSDSIVRLLRKVQSERRYAGIDVVIAPRRANGFYSSWRDSLVVDDEATWSAQLERQRREIDATALAAVSRVKEPDPVAPEQHAVADGEVYRGTHYKAVINDAPAYKVAGTVESSYLTPKAKPAVTGENTGSLTADTLAYDANYSVPPTYVAPPAHSARSEIPADDASHPNPNPNPNPNPSALSDTSFKGQNSNSAKPVENKGDTGSGQGHDANKAIDSTKVTVDALNCKWICFTVLVVIAVAVTVFLATLSLRPQGGGDTQKSRQANNANAAAAPANPSLKPTLTWTDLVALKGVPTTSQIFFVAQAQSLQTVSANIIQSSGCGWQPLDVHVAALTEHLKQQFKDSAWMRRGDDLIVVDGGEKLQIEIPDTCVVVSTVSQSDSTTSGFLPSSSKLPSKPPASRIANPEPPAPRAEQKKTRAAVDEQVSGSLTPEASAAAARSVESVKPESVYSDGTDNVQRNQLGNP